MQQLFTIFTNFVWFWKKGNCFIIFYWLLKGFFFVVTWGEYYFLFICTTLCLTTSAFINATEYLLIEWLEIRADLKGVMDEWVGWRILKSAASKLKVNVHQQKWGWGRGKGKEKEKEKRIHLFTAWTSDPSSCLCLGRLVFLPSQTCHSVLGKLTSW